MKRALDSYVSMGNRESDQILILKLIASIKSRLDPVDPSQGLIQSQGPHTFHLAYFIVLQFIVKYIDEESYTCFNQIEGNFKEQEDPGIPILNQVGRFVAKMHFVCWLCMVTAKFYLPKSLSSNSLSLTLILNFLTVPIFIFIIFRFQHGQELTRFKVQEGSTVDDLKIMGTICVSKDNGNIKQWINIEMLTFYGNILVMMLLLLKQTIFNQNHGKRIEVIPRNEDERRIKQVTEAAVKENIEQQDLLQRMEQER